MIWLAGTVRVSWPLTGNAFEVAQVTGLGALQSDVGVVEADADLPFFGVAKPTSN
jgi:hypothetical protein